MCGAESALKTKGGKSFLSYPTVDNRKSPPPTFTAFF
jgi:hypothetical protein